MRIAPDGKVGIGTPTPAQMLSVAGTIQSTTGGFLFPDGTTQTTAARAASGQQRRLWPEQPGRASPAGRATPPSAPALSANTEGNANTATAIERSPPTRPGPATPPSASARSFNTTGYDNTASGFQALFSNTTGSDNTAIGVSALRSNTTGTRTPPAARVRSTQTRPATNTASGGALRQHDRLENGHGYRRSTPTRRGSQHRQRLRGALRQHDRLRQHRQRLRGARLPTPPATATPPAVSGRSLHNTTGIDNTAIGRGALSGNTTGVLQSSADVGIYWSALGSEHDRAQKRRHRIHGRHMTSRPAATTSHRPSRGSRRRRTPSASARRALRPGRSSPASAA